MTTGTSPLADATVRWHTAPHYGGPAVFVDIDGVLSDAAGRQHFLDGTLGRKDWKAFFDACGDDPAVDEIHRLLDLLDPGLSVCLVTARPGRVVDETLAWLERYAVRWDLLVLRPDRDPRLAVEFKRDVLRALRELGYDIRLGFEDDPRNVAMLHEEGVPCVYVHSGYYRSGSDGPTS
jgi:phosphoglycolate phosphatase-like HAD superfamily hydrolase